MKNDIFINSTKGMIGLALKYTWRGYGSALFLEFGRLLQQEGRNHPQGEYSLMLDCDWRVEKPRSILFGSFSGLKRIENQIRMLIGAKVTRVETTGYLPEIIVSLSTDMRVSSFSSDQGQPEWTLFLPDKSWLHCKRGVVINERAEPSPSL
jgi:hypothetical protein